MDGMNKYFTADEIDKLIEVGPEKAVREIFKNKKGCRCKECEELHDNVIKHLEHPFYKDAQDYREQERVGQIVKGSEKYPEPFNPLSWTPKQLLQHAMQENIDQGHYQYGLYVWINKLEHELDELKFAKQEAEFWRLRAVELNEKLNGKSGGESNE